ncbi:pyridine nucleotide-disulfide oxidoreductase, partial [bacterium]|nr:pyridine nucleotide-disulfide oxidoreductase [bacterium]
FLSLMYEMAQIIHEEINVHGINLILNDGISQFAESGKTVILDSGTKLPTDMTIMALGVIPENTLAKNANLKLGQRGHVVTDNNFNVYDAEDKKEEDIFAIGDMIEVINPLDNSPYAVPLAWGANRQGRLVADYISGIKIKPSKIMGASVIKVFDLTAASTGASEATLIEKKIEYKAIHAHRANHASYYPNSSNIALKLLYGKDGRILGAQAVGREGTEKRIDVISTVMRLNGSVFDLSDLELCYAPPYSSAKDPVNILGYIAENIESGIYSMAYAQDIDKIIESGGLLLDVRTPFEYENGHIEGSLNLELDTLRDNLDKITVYKDTPIYVTCRVGLRAYMAIKILRANGFTKLYNLSGGYSTYLNYKYQTHFTDVKLEKVEKEGNDNENNLGGMKEIDVTGIQCPGPLMATFKELSSMKAGEVLKVVASDCGFTADIKNWCKTNGHKLLDLQVGGGKYTAVIEKGDGGRSNMVNISQQNATIVVFSGEIDKVIASMIIAQGAAAQGKDVTMFFTFWGLNALRKDNKVSVKKNLIEKMFGVMMPRGAEKLPLSNMNMGGIGQKMIKSIMKKKNVDSVSLMIQKAQEAGVKMIACTMSMDLMGIKAEELIDGIEYAGVATYISKNENVGTTLFI